MKFSKELKAGLIAILAIVGFVILFQFMKGKNLFSTDDVYFVKYNNVEGLAKSNPVSINGLKVGQVDDIIPITKQIGKIYFVVKISMDDGFKFSRNSVVEIYEPGLMSGKELRINLGYGGDVAKDGDTLAGNFKPSALNSLASEVKPVKDQLQVVLKRIDSVAMSTNALLDTQNRAEIRALLNNLNRTVRSFESTSRATNALLADNNPRVAKVLDNANLATISARNTIDKFGNIADNVDVKKLNQTIDNLSITADKLNSVISGIQNGQGSLGKLAKDEALYNNLTQTSANLNKLIEDVKANPKRYINFSVFGKNTKD